MAATRSRAEAPVRRVKTTPLMTAAGSWSFIPTQEVSWRPISPSAVVSPNRQPAASSKARATADRPLIRDVTESFRWTA